VRLLLATVLLIFTQDLVATPAIPDIPEIPLEFDGGLLWLKVSHSQSTNPLNFVVDSGASVSVLDLSTARRLGLRLGRNVNVTAVGMAVTGRWPVKLLTRVEKLELPGEYLALDLSGLSAACDRPIDGLLGADFFRNRIVQLDYAAEKLRLLASAPPAPGTGFVPLEVRPGGFRVAVSVNGGSNQWVRMDTGCATAFQWVTSMDHAARGAFKRSTGLAEISIPQTMTGVRIGNHLLDTVPTGLHRKPLFPGESGLLGNGLLAGFGVVTIDAKAGRLFLGSQK
jgi:hypothetical protein